MIFYILIYFIVLFQQVVLFNEMKKSSTKVGRFSFVFMGGVMVSECWDWVMG